MQDLCKNEPISAHPSMCTHNSRILAICRDKCDLILIDFEMQKIAKTAILNSLHLPARLLWKRDRLGEPLQRVSLGELMSKTPEPTGLEPATSAVTGQRSNQLS